MPPAPPTTPGPFGSKLLRKGSRTVLGMDPQKIIKNFFGANSGITIVVLVLISRNPRWIRINMPASLGKPFYPGV